MTKEVEKGLGKIGVTISKPLLALITLIIGVLIVYYREEAPSFVALIIGLYLIIQGILFFIDYFELRRK